MPSAQTPQDDPVATVEFVFSECMRLQERMTSDEKVIPNSPEALEFFYRLPHPSVAWSFLVCGRAADQALRRLSHQAASHAGIVHFVSNTLVRKELGEIIVRKFLKERRPIDRKNVDRALSEAAKLAARQRRTYTHYIPCHLMHASSPPEFAVGPVLFRTQSSFRSHIASAMIANRDHFKSVKTMIVRTLRYYRSFCWVAEVTVPQCDRTTSKDIASRTVEAALNCLHVLLEPRYTHRMSIAGPNLSRDWRGTLTVSQDNELGYSMGWQNVGSVSFDDDWFERFDHPTYRAALELCGVALESMIDPSLQRPLSTRFLDAVLWFGEAVREHSPSAKVVKYATALERMVMTDEKSDITKLMSERVASICCENPHTSFDSWLQDAQRLYSLRSKLVHGSLSPYSAEVNEGVSLGAKLGETVLLYTLLGFGEYGLREENVKRTKLSNWFNSIVSQVEMERTSTARP